MEQVKTMKQQRSLLFPGCKLFQHECSETVSLPLHVVIVAGSALIVVEVSLG